MLPTAGDSLISNLFYMKGDVNWIGIKFKLLCMEVGDQATKRRDHNPVFKDGHREFSVRDIMLLW